MARANPTACCGIKVPCCPSPIAETLKATVSNNADCACADGAQITLHYQNPEEGIEYWEGTGTVCGVQETLKLECINAPPEELFRLTGEACFYGPHPSTPESTCDPLNLIFWDGGSGCCDDPVTADVTITVTE